MATHRPHDTGFAPEFDFLLTLAVLKASERSGARHRPTTPAALARRLRAHSSPPAPTISQIEAALRQIDCWRQHTLTRELLGHCRQVAALRARVEAEQCRLAEDWVYLNRMLQDARELLERAAQTGEPAAGARRALQ